MLKQLNVFKNLKEATELLKAISDTPELDASLLLAHTLKLRREALYALPPHTNLNASQQLKFRVAMQKRLQNYPVAYIINYREFFGRNFYIEEGVLIPRPDSEVLIEAVIDLNQEKRFKTIRDVGTGSGCLAITLALELAGTRVTASDVAGPVAQRVFDVNNSALAAKRVKYRTVSLLDDGESYDLIVANLPYLTSEEVAEKQAENWREPTLALDGGTDGLELITKLIEQSAGRCGVIALEADPRQMVNIELCLKANGFKTTSFAHDLAGDKRVVIGCT